jgi:hypothetical protein
MVEGLPSKRLARTTSARIPGAKGHFHALIYQSGLMYLGFNVPNQRVGTVLEAPNTPASVA